MLERDDLNNLLGEVFLDAERPLEEDLEVWGIEYEGFMAVLTAATLSTLQDIVHNKDPKMSLQTQFLGAFALGYKCRLEIETREVADAS